IVHPCNLSGVNTDDDPTPGKYDTHGTPCAGVACADGRYGASGVAPEANLMPIRQAGGLGSLDEALAFVWATDNGADVISCSWGPKGSANSD
ncbi:S8 family serine peptidase, partial [Escherichia coli]